MQAAYAALQVMPEPAARAAQGHVPFIVHGTVNSLVV